MEKLIKEAPEGGIDNKAADAGGAHAIDEVGAFKLSFGLNTKESEGTLLSNYDSNAVNNRITHFSVESEQVPATKAGEMTLTPNYFVGALDNQKLVLTKLSNFHQFRPSFKHVDEERMQRM